MVKNLYSLIISVAIFGFMFGCAQTPISSKKAPLLQVDMTAADRIQFEGRGAGAGVMLSSTMGPMGIAIGAAIDEGIGKEIDSTASANDFNFSSLLKAAFIQSGALADFDNMVTVKVKRVGFKTWPGPNDQVIAHIKIEVNADNRSYAFDYPSMLSDEEKKLVTTYTFPEIKTDYEQIELLMVKGLELIAVKLKNKAEDKSS